jgi:hypothetical protein
VTPCCLAPTPPPTALPSSVNSATNSNSSCTASPGCSTNTIPTTVAIPISYSSAVDGTVLPMKKKPFTFLCLGIICPRKNQLWTVQVFKKFCQNHHLQEEDVRLQIVGARYTRVYEIEYLDKVKQEIASSTSNDGNHLDFSRMIEVYDVTDDVEHFYRNADCLILTSLNEVTPMVISESFSWSLPVISTNIAGIQEMFVNGIEGYHFPPDNEASALFAMHSLYSNPTLREHMSIAARRRFEQYFDVNLMVDNYRNLVLEVSPPVILVDMDGALIDWDKGFYTEWQRKGYHEISRIDRSLSYFMEKCIVPMTSPDSIAMSVSCNNIENTSNKTTLNWEQEAESIFLAPGFFEGLEAMEGALEAIREMDSSGLFKVYICTTPILHSQYCAQEKLNWIRKHLGESWLSKVILCADKVMIHCWFVFLFCFCNPNLFSLLQTMVAGDLLIDDKPYEYLSPGGNHTTATWKVSRIFVLSQFQPWTYSLSLSLSLSVDCFHSKSFLMLLIIDKNVSLVCFVGKIGKVMSILF